MADNVLESGPPSATMPTLSSPALSVSASDGNDFVQLLDLENDLPDELINSPEQGLPNWMPSAPNVNPPSQTDLRSIETAYAALQLNYQGNQASIQNQQTSVPAQPGMRTLNNIGGNALMTNQHPGMLSDSSESDE